MFTKGWGGKNQRARGEQIVNEIQRGRRVKSRYALHKGSKSQPASPANRRQTNKILREKENGRELGRKDPKIKASN